MVKNKTQKEDNSNISAQMLRAEQFLELEPLSGDYKIVFQRELEQFSTEFAKAHPVQGTSIEAYALIFNAGFPVRLNVVKEISEMKEVPAVQKILDYGLIKSEITGSEHVAVILEIPKGIPLMEFINKYGALDEKFISEKILPPLINALSAFAFSKICHTSINPNKIYYNQENQEIKLLECISSYPGYYQSSGYETIERLQVPIYAKGAGSFSSDYFALGMLTYHLLCGGHPQWDLPHDLIFVQRFTFGSYGSVIEASEYTEKLTMTKRMNQFLIGTLTDHTVERWNIRSLQAWADKIEVPAKRSRIHKETSTPIIFDGIEYTSRKYLAHNIFKKWNIARRTLKVGELARWAGLSLKDQALSEQLESMDLGGKTEVIMPEERLMRLIIVLDPEGPIRYQGFSSGIFGLGDYLAYNYLSGNNELVQSCAKIIGEGIVEVWLRRQTDMKEYNPAKLGWSPRWAREHLRKKGLGFGLERLMYELNHTLPCQSDRFKGRQIIGMKDMLTALDDAERVDAEFDPIDRHIAAFIACRVGMEDELKIKSLINFPYIGKLPQVVMVGFFTLAQASCNNIKLSNLSGWIAFRLKAMIEQLHSRSVRDEITSKLKKAAESGSIKEIYNVVANPINVKRDLYGYEDAKKKYFSLGVKINGLKHKLYIQLRAYNEGLKYAVIFSWLAFVSSVIWSILRL